MECALYEREADCACVFACSVPSQACEEMMAIDLTLYHPLQNAVKGIQQICLSKVENLDVILKVK
jgi:hypothetical protein